MENGQFGECDYLIREIQVKNKVPNPPFGDAGNGDAEKETLLSTEANRVRNEVLLPDQENAPQAAVVVPPSLNQLKLQESFKKRISRKYTEAEIDLAVKRVLKWTNRISDEASLSIILERASDWNDQDTRDEIEEKNFAYLRSLDYLDKKVFKGMQISICHSYLEISGGTKCETFPINDKDFIPVVKSHLSKLGAC